MMNLSTPSNARTDAPAQFRKWICAMCDYIYDEEVGDPEHGLAPGTRYADIPEEWSCPDCGVTKADFYSFDE